MEAGVSAAMSGEPGRDDDCRVFSTPGEGMTTGDERPEEEEEEEATPPLLLCVRPFVLFLPLGLGECGEVTAEARAEREEADPSDCGLSFALSEEEAEEDAAAAALSFEEEKREGSFLGEELAPEVEEDSPFPPLLPIAEKKEEKRRRGETAQPGWRRRNLEM
jgi:hypothetical protein